MDIINFMKDPLLVVKFQNYFGIENFVNQDSGKCSVNNPISFKENKSSNSEKQRTSHSSNGKSKNELKWSNLLLGDGMVGSNSENLNDSHQEQEDTSKGYRINNWFWFYFFSIATQTGDELFYITFFPFWKWNVDGAVFRNVIYMWLITMYIGQALKDVIKVPRPPCPPVIRLDSKWRLEYGLPSTHAMVAFSIPFSLLTLSVHRYQLNYEYCFLVALFWCVSVSLSRIYLGMHSILDVVAGLILSFILVTIGLPYIQTFDYFMLTHPLSPLISIPLSIAMVVYYPSTDRWTSARGDTTVIVGVGCGCLVGSWLNFQMGIISEPDFQPPFAVMWPSPSMVGLLFVRTVLGLGLLIAVRFIFKRISFRGICALLKVSVSDFKYDPVKVPAPHRLIVELFYKFITYTFIGFAIVFVAPLLFSFLGIERPMFYTEM